MFRHHCQDTRSQYTVCQRIHSCFHKNWAKQRYLNRQNFRHLSKSDVSRHLAATKRCLQTKPFFTFGHNHCLCYSVYELLKLSRHGLGWCWMGDLLGNLSCCWEWCCLLVVSELGENLFSDPKKINPNVPKVRGRGYCAAGDAVASGKRLRQGPDSQQPLKIPWHSSSKEKGVPQCPGYIPNLAHSIWAPDYPPV